MTKREEKEQREVKKIGLIQEAVSQFRKSEIFKRAVSTILVSAFLGSCYFFISWKDRFVVINGLPIIVEETKEAVKVIDKKVYRIDRKLAIDSAIDFQYKKGMQDDITEMKADIKTLIARH